MQTHDIVKPIDECSDDELIERLRALRHRREVLRPVAKAKAAKAEKKTSNKKITALEKLLDGMSDAERAKLLETLTEGT